MHHLMRLIIVLAMLLPAPLLAQTESDGDEATTESQEEEFRELTRSANEKFNDEDYAGAIADYEAAYEIKPVSNILYNIARLYEKDGQLDPALEYYQRFVKAPNVDQAPRQDALERIKTIKEVIALDEEETEEEDEMASTPESSPPPASSGPDHTVAYVFWGAAGAALIGSGVFAFLTMNANSDFEDATSLQDRRDAADSGETFGLVADSLLVGGVVLGVTGTLFYFLNDSETDTSSASLFPFVSQDSAGVGFSATFE